MIATICLSLGAVVSVAVPVIGLVRGVERAVFQASRPGAVAAVLIEERLHFGAAHRIAVEELAVGDDVARVETVSVAQILLSFLGRHERDALSDERGGAPRQRHGAHRRQRGARRGEDAPAPSSPLPPAAQRVASGLRLRAADRGPCRCAVPGVFGVVSPDVFLGGRTGPAVALLAAVPSSGPPGVVPLLLTCCHRPSL